METAGFATLSGVTYPCKPPCVEFSVVVTSLSLCLAELHAYSISAYASQRGSEPERLFMQGSKRAICRTVFITTFAIPRPCTFIFFPPSVIFAWNLSCTLTTKRAPWRKETASQMLKNPLTMKTLPPYHRHPRMLPSSRLFSTEN